MVVVIVPGAADTGLGESVRAILGDWSGDSDQRRSSVR
jgi:hypothetical protein